MSASASVDLAEAVLAAIVGFWPAVPDVDLPYLQPLPDRQYVSTGTPPADCEQLVVSIERTFGNDGNPALERIVPIGSGIPYLRTMVASVQILRCVSVVDTDAAGDALFPDPAVMQAEAGVILTDSDGVLACIIAAQAAGELANCGGMALENWRAITAEGGLAGGVTKVRLNLF